MAGPTPAGGLIYVGLRSDGLHHRCTVCMTAPMKAVQGWDLEEGGSWLWYQCAVNARHITRAVPLPVQMARGV